MSVARARLVHASAGRASVSRPATPKFWSSSARLSTRATSTNPSSSPRLGLWASLSLGTLVLGGALYASGSSSSGGTVLLDAKQKKYVPVSPVSEALRVISFEEVQRHNTSESAWVVIHNKVYDLTAFAKKHPGGAAIILANAGQDVTAMYDSVHPIRFLTAILKPQDCLGEIDPSTLPEPDEDESEEVKRIKEAQEVKPPLRAIINIDDFERAAQPILTDAAWAYYSGAAEEESSHRNNLTSYSRYEFRPRCLRKSANADPSTTFVGIPTSLPIYISPAAAAGLGAPEGELSLARGAGQAGIIQGVSNMATFSAEEIAGARVEGQEQVFQIYIHPDWNRSEALIRKAEKLGYKAIILTVDTTILGKREVDMRAAAAVSGDADESTLGVARAMGSFYDENLGWDVVPWLKGITKLPIILKGIQCVEDVQLAHEHGVSGVVLSNHGGRQLA